MKLAQMFGGERVELPSRRHGACRSWRCAPRAAASRRSRVHLTARAGACSRCWPRRAARSAPAPARSDEARTARGPRSARAARGPDHGLSHASSLLSPRPHCLRERVWVRVHCVRDSLRSARLRLLCGRQHSEAQERDGAQSEMQVRRKGTLTLPSPAHNRGRGHQEKGKGTERSCKCSPSAKLRRLRVVGFAPIAVSLRLPR